MPLPWSRPREGAHAYMRAREVAPTSAKLPRRVWDFDNYCLRLGCCCLASECGTRPTWLFPSKTSGPNLRADLADSWLQRPNFFFRPPQPKPKPGRSQSQAPCRDHLTLPRSRLHTRSQTHRTKVSQPTLQQPRSLTSPAGGGKVVAAMNVEDIARRLGVDSAATVGKAKELCRIASLKLPAGSLGQVGPATGALRQLAPQALAGAPAGGHACLPRTLKQAWRACTASLCCGAGGGGQDGGLPGAGVRNVSGDSTSGGIWASSTIVALAAASGLQQMSSRCSKKNGVLKMWLLGAMLRTR